jgi:hypothetical protein
MMMVQDVYFGHSFFQGLDLREEILKMKVNRKFWVWCAVLPVA